MGDGKATLVGRPFVLLAVGFCILLIAAEVLMEEASRPLPPPPTLDDGIASLNSGTPGYQSLHVAHTCFEKFGADAVWERVRNADWNSKAARFLAVAGVLRDDPRFLPVAQALATSDSGISSMGTQALHDYAARHPATSAASKPYLLQ